jgi:hypothetical protein
MDTNTLISCKMGAWRKVTSHMPHFYNHSNTKEFGKITVKPKQWYRRLFKLGSYSIWPYTTMGKIEFTLQVEQLPQRDGINRNDQNVYIRLGDGSYRTLITLVKKSTPVKGVAEYTGDTKFFIAPAGYSDRNSERFIAKEGILLFDDNVLSINHYIFGGGSVIVLIFSCLCVLLGWLLGLIRLIPVWEMWIPIK